MSGVKDYHSDYEYERLDIKIKYEKLDFYCNEFQCECIMCTEKWRKWMR